MNKFVELTRRNRDYQKENIWYNECQRQQIPFITVVTRTKQADVHWDYITYDKAVDAVLTQKTDRITGGIQEIYLRYALEASECQVSAHLAWIKNIPIEQARAAARDVYDFIADVTGTLKAADRTESWTQASPS